MKTLDFIFIIAERVILNNNSLQCTLLYRSLFLLLFSVSYTHPPVVLHVLDFFVLLSVFGSTDAITLP